MDPVVGGRTGTIPCDDRGKMRGAVVFRTDVGFSRRFDGAFILSLPLLRISENGSRFDSVTGNGNDSIVIGFDVDCRSERD